MLQMILNIVSAVITGIVAWCVAHVLRQARRVEQASLATNLKLDALERSSSELAVVTDHALSSIRSSARAMLERTQVFDARIADLSASLEILKKGDHESDRKLGI